jgi:hypothetical protein
MSDDTIGPETPDDTVVEFPGKQGKGSGDAAKVKGKTKVRSRKLSNGLTEKQEAFCQAIINEGCSLSAAYRQAYNAESMSNASVWQNAHKTSRLDKVRVRIEQLSDARDRSTLHDGRTIKEFVIQNLQDLAHNAARDSDKLKATELLGKLTDVAAFTERSETEIVDKRTAADVENELMTELDKLLSRSA